MRTIYTIIAATVAASLSVSMVACSADSESASENAGAVNAPVTALGSGTSAPTFTTIYQDTVMRQPIDLGFNPQIPDQLWVLNYADDSVNIMQGLSAKDGAQATVQNRHDPAAAHFMHLPTQMSFGAVNFNNQSTWATCGNGNNGGNFFMGPSLFAADLSIFAETTPGGLGSHLDMLHLTSYCRGLVHEDFAGTAAPGQGNVYYTYNGQFGSIERYDFVKDHGPGNEDHSDGTVKRYVTGKLSVINSAIPSNLAWDAAKKLLYIADSGSGRILALDPNTGTVGQNLHLQEPMAKAVEVLNATLTEVVPAGVMQVPSGLHLDKGILYATDAKTSQFFAFTTEGKLITKLDTGLQPASLAGLTVGPDGKIWFTDRRAGKVLRLDVQ